MTLFASCLFATSAIAGALAAYHLVRDIVLRLRSGSLLDGIRYSPLPEATWQGLQLAVGLLIAGAILESVAVRAIP